MTAGSRVWRSIWVKTLENWKYCPNKCISYSRHIFTTERNSYISLYISMPAVPKNLRNGMKTKWYAITRFELKTRQNHVITVPYHSTFSTCSTCFAALLRRRIIIIIIISKLFNNGNPSAEAAFQGAVLNSLRGTPYEKITLVLNYAVNWITNAWTYNFPN